MQGGSCQSEKDRDREPACLTEGGVGRKPTPPLFLIHANGILHAIPILRRFEQSQLFKLQHKAADRRIGSVPKALFQLLGGKLHVAISRQNKLPQCFLLLSDLPVEQGGLKRLGCLCGRKRPVQLMITQ